MKRRAFLRTVAGVAGMAASAGLRETAAPWLGSVESKASADEHDAAEAKTTRIVLIGHQPDHPPGTHLYLDECRLLADCLKQTPGVEAVVSDGWPQDAALLDGVSALVLYSSPGAEILLKGGNRETVEKLLESGVGLTALHWATGIGDYNDQALVEKYLNAMGGIFGFGWSGLDVSQSRVEPADPQHPICRGWTSYPLNEEWYLDLRFLPGAKPIAKARVKGKDQVVAWAYERPGARPGRSYGNTLGHFHENFLIEPFRKAIVNGILWTTHREIPAEGAPCKIAGA